jgi:flagellar biogenesis protein FliO
MTVRGYPGSSKERAMFTGLIIITALAFFGLYLVMRLRRHL